MGNSLILIEELFCTIILCYIVNNRDCAILTTFCFISKDIILRKIFKNQFNNDLNNYIHNIHNEKGTNTLEHLR